MNYPGEVRKILEQVANDHYSYGESDANNAVSGNKVEPGDIDRALSVVCEYIRESVGENQTSSSKPFGMPENLWARHKGRDDLREEIRTKWTLKEDE